MPLARDDRGRRRLAHLRGHVDTGPLDATAMAYLVAGPGGQTIRAADPSASFAAVVRINLDRTTDLVVAITREAEEVVQLS